MNTIQEHSLLVDLNVYNNVSKETQNFIEGAMRALSIEFDNIVTMSEEWDEFYIGDYTKFSDIVEVVPTHLIKDVDKKEFKQLKTNATISYRTIG